MSTDTALPAALANFLLFLCAQDPDGEGLIETNYTVDDARGVWREDRIEMLDELRERGFIKDSHPFIDITTAGRELARALQEQR